MPKFKLLYVLVIKVFLSDRSVIIANIYRRPILPTIDVEEELTVLAEFLNGFSQNIILMGDLNMDLNNKTDARKGLHLQQFLDSNG